MSPGSFEVDLLLELQKHAADALAFANNSILPILGSAKVKQTKDIIDVLRGVIDIRKFLKGKSPEKVTYGQDKEAKAAATIYNFHGDNIIMLLKMKKSIKV